MSRFFKVVGVNLDLDKCAVDELLTTDKYYKEGHDINVDNTFEAAKQELLSQNYIVFFDNEDYTVFAAKYNDGFKMFMFHILWKELGKGKNLHENSAILKDLDSIRLEEEA